MKCVFVITCCICCLSFLTTKQILALSTSILSDSDKVPEQPHSLPTDTPKPNQIPTQIKPDSLPIIPVTPTNKQPPLIIKPTTPSITKEKPTQKKGNIIHTYNKVHIYSNGNNFTTSQGNHYASDGYYYGQKWQCVEFVKRYFHIAHKHHMPNVWGHAKNFFNPKIKHGKHNSERNMTQFHNGKNQPPKVNDLIVWNNMSSFGHVAIISKVNANSITVVQQNIPNQPIEKIPYSKINNKHQVGTPHSGNQPIGWLRIP